MRERILQYAQQLLIAGLEHTEWPIRFAAAEFLAMLHDARGDEILQEGLSAETFIRIRAVAAMGNIQSCHQALVKAFTDRYPQVRGQALKSLAQTGFASTDMLIAGLCDSRNSVHECAIAALSMVEQKRAKPLLESVALGREYDCLHPARLLAAFFLAKNNNEIGRKVLYDSLQCEDSQVAFQAAEKLAHLGDCKGLPHLKYMLQWGGWPEKLSALEALIKLGQHRDIAVTLYRPSEFPNAMMRLRAIRLLDYLYPENTCKILVQLLSEDDEEIQARVLEIIGEIGRLELAELTESFLRQAPEHLRAIAVMSIEKIGSTAILPYLLPVLEKSHWLLRLQAARVVIKLGSARK